MEDEIFPRHYADWKKCITEKCKISLTKEYILNPHTFSKKTV